jgi:hypothetical protein
MSKMLTEISKMSKILPKTSKMSKTLTEISKMSKMFQQQIGMLPGVEFNNKLNHLLQPASNFHPPGVNSINLHFGRNF